MFEVFLRSYQSGAYTGLPVAYPVPESTLPFPRWRMNDIRKVLSADIPLEHSIAWNFVDGDHWQGGWGYAGPMIDPAHPNYDRLMTEIIKGFCSRNVIREIAKTHVNGVLGRPMRWSLAPKRATADERDETDNALKTKIAEASVIVRQWLESRRAHELLREFLMDLLMPPGIAVMRLFMPSGSAAGTLTPGSRLLSRETGAEFARTMAGIYIDKPDISRGRVYTDPETMREIGMSLFRAKNRTTGQFQDAASVTFLDSSGDRTMVGTIYEDGTSTAVGYPLGGRLTTYQATRDPLITAQLLQQQRILNYAESTIPRNLTTAGFLDRILKSVHINGKWVQNDDGTESYVVEEADIPRFGPGEITVLNPIVLEDEEGRKTVTEPDMIRGEPVSPQGSIDSSDHIYDNMRRESEMSHLVEGEENESSIIRYGLSLLESAIPMTGAYRWLIETGLAWTEAVRGEQGKYTDELRVQTSCFLNVGPVSPEQRGALTSAFEKSLLSRETAQEHMGIEDVDEENDRIAAQPGAAIDLKIRMANSYKMLIDAGMPPLDAALESGYSPERAQEIAANTEKQKAEEFKRQQETLKLEAKLAPKPNAGGQRSQNASGLRAKRQGRPSGTAERNPGQQQDKGARALQNKKRNRRPV